MILPDEAATWAAGAALAKRVRPGDAITLSGDLGMGKTSLVRGLLAALGLEGEAPSPSYALLLTYGPPELPMPVAHADLYRLDHPEELDELGLDDARADGLLLVEWPERAADAPVLSDALALRLEQAGEGRRLTAVVPPSWEARWPPR